MVWKNGTKRWPCQVLKQITSCEALHGIAERHSFVERLRVQAVEGTKAVLTKISINETNSANTVWIIHHKIHSKHKKIRKITLAFHFIKRKRVLQKYTNI